MRQPVEQRGGHLGVAEYTGPFAKGQVGGDDDRGLLVEAADQVEQQLAAGLGEWQIAEFVRSTTLKNRPRAPSRMQARAIAMARCVLPVPGEAAAYCRVSAGGSDDPLSLSPDGGP